MINTQNSETVVLKELYELTVARRDHPTNYFSASFIDHGIPVGEKFRPGSGVRTERLLEDLVKKGLALKTDVQLYRPGSVDQYVTGFRAHLENEERIQELLK